MEEFPQKGNSGESDPGITVAMRKVQTRRHARGELEFATPSHQPTKPYVSSPLPRLLQVCGLVPDPHNMCSPKAVGVAMTLSQTTAKTGHTVEDTI